MAKRYGSITALEGINLTVREKEYVAIIGPSGCGKSTLIKCIAGIIEPDEGEILVNGISMKNVPIQRRKMGYVFQDLTLFPHMRIIENVSYGPRVQGQGLQSSRVLVSELLDLIELSDRSDSFPSELSGGAQQKVAVSRALASGSTLLLFDEPFGALDAKVRTELRYEIKKMTTDLGLTVLHVTHDQEEAMSIGDRIVVMKAGRIVEDGSPIELYLRPKTIFTANFLGEANFLEGKMVERTRIGSLVQVGETYLQTIDQTRKVGEKVIVAVRPEFLHVVRDTKDQNCLKGKISEIRFMGYMTRYEIEISEGRILSVDHPVCFGELDLELQDEVAVAASSHHIMIYPLPQEGLERELQLE